MRRSALQAVVAVTALGLLAAACGDDEEGSAGAAPGEVTVFAAASLAAAFEEIGAAFEATNTGADVTLSFAASSDLVRQINEGAPADVFASADLPNMQKLVDEGGNGAAPVLFATNSLQIVVEPGNPKRISAVADLEDTGLITVVCAPEAPCGAYAATLFANAGVNVTPDSLEENVKAVVTKVSAGEADAGIVYATDVLAAGARVQGIEIPPEVNVVAEYPIVITKGASAGDAQAFVDFVLGVQGQAILAKYGFAPVR